MNNFLDDEKNRNKYLSPTEMNCLGILLLFVVYCYPIIIIIMLAFE